MNKEEKEDEEEVRFRSILKRSQQTNTNHPPHTA